MDRTLTFDFFVGRPSSSLLRVSLHLATLLFWRGKLLLTTLEMGLGRDDVLTFFKSSVLKITLKVWIDSLSLLSIHLRLVSIMNFWSLTSSSSPHASTSGSDFWFTSEVIIRTFVDARNELLMWTLIGGLVTEV